MVGREQHDGAGDTSHERVSDAQRRGAHRNNVVAKRADRHGPGDRYTEIHHDGPSCRIEERMSEAANGNSEKDEYNE